MALSVTSSQNQKTWDATVRVTGGHPLQLWGIGESQRAAEPELQVDRVVVRDETERMVGYGQLQIRREKVGRGGASVVVAECLNVHSNRGSTIPGLLDALAEHAAAHWDAALFSAELDAPSSPELVDSVRAHGWQRTGEVPEGQGGPRRLRVNLGSTESDLSSRLSSDTLDRCRAGLRVSDVAVREVTERSGDLRAAGLKTEQIGRLLHELGQDSLLLVATQERPGQEPIALGYLWFVHTVGQAMLYRVGFTRTARELGIDDALLLTGAVELQKRGVQRLDGGDVSDPDVPTVVRELADVERVILGSWRKPLGADTMAEAPSSSGPAATADDGQGERDRKPGGRRRRGLFGRARAEEPSPAPAEPAAAAPAEPERTVDAATDAAADRAAAERRRDVRRQVSSDLGVEATDQTPAVTSASAASASAQPSGGTAEPQEGPASSADAAASAGTPTPSAGAKAPSAAAKARTGGSKAPVETAAPGDAEDSAATEPTAEKAAPKQAAGADGGKPAAKASKKSGKKTGRAAAKSPGQKPDATSSTSESSPKSPEPKPTAAAPEPEQPAKPPEQKAPAERADAQKGADAPNGQKAASSPSAAEQAPVRPVGVEREKARREREFKAEQRRAERVAQKAQDFEARQEKPKESIGKRLRREASGAIRDALGR